MAMAWGPSHWLHVDPFKLLITDRVNHLLRRLPGVAGSPGTAMVMCCNMGGERFSNAYSSAHNFYSRAQGAAPGVEVTDVAAMLPNMLSGYPAQIFDFKGFHQTLVGTAGLFWQTLLASPQWFNDGITTLLLGAGRFVSGEIEVERARSSAITQGEGLGLIALRRYQPDAADKPLLVIRAAVLAHAAGSLEEACQRLDKAPSDYPNVDVCELQPAATPASGSLQEMTGFLAEASGIETLLAVMLKGATHSVIEVRDAGKTVMWLFTEKLRQWSPTAAEASSPIKHPFMLRFAHSSSHELQQVITPARPVSTGPRTTERWRRRTATQRHAHQHLALRAAGAGSRHGKPVRPAPWRHNPAPDALAAQRGTYRDRQRPAQPTVAARPARGG